MATFTLLLIFLPAGMTYCAISALEFLSKTRKQKLVSKIRSPQTEEHAALLRWLVIRQTAVLNSPEEENDDDDDSSNDNDGERAKSTRIESEEIDQVTDLGNAHDRITKLPNLIPLTEDQYEWAGFNGRQNKPADTCYSFWVNGTIAVRSASGVARSAPFHPTDRL